MPPKKVGRPRKKKSKTKATGGSSDDGDADSPPNSSRRQAKTKKSKAKPGASAAAGNQTGPGRGQRNAAERAMSDINAMLDRGEVFSDDSAEEDAVGPAAAQGSANSMFHETKPVNALFASVNAGAHGVEDHLMNDLFDLFMSIKPPLRCRIMVAREKGKRERHAHIHGLFEGRLLTDQSTRRKFSNWIRKFLGGEGGLTGRGKRLAKRYEVKIVALTEAAQSFDMYCAYMAKDLGQPHHNNQFSGFTIDELIEWVIAFREIRNDLTSGKILMDQDNMMRLVLDYYNAHSYPVKMSFLQATTFYLQDGHAVINPNMLSKYPMDRERYEAYWNLFRLDDSKNIRHQREDVQTVLFGTRAKGDREARDADEPWQGYESDEDESTEHGFPKDMSLEGMKEMAKEQYARRAATEVLDETRGQAFPDYKEKRHASGETFYEYCGVQIVGAVDAVTRVFHRMGVRGHEATEVQQRSGQESNETEVGSPIHSRSGSPLYHSPLSPVRPIARRNSVDVEDDLVCVQVSDMEDSHGLDEEQEELPNTSAYHEAMAGLRTSGVTRAVQATPKNNRGTPKQPHSTPKKSRDKRKASKSPVLSPDQDESSDSEVALLSESP